MDGQPTWHDIKHTDARKLHDEAAVEFNDPIGVDATRRIARQIVETIRDPKMHPTIPIRVARAVTDNKITPAELAEALDSIIAKRASGGFRVSAGAYFVTIMKRIFQYHEVPW